MPGCDFSNSATRWSIAGLQRRVEWLPDGDDARFWLGFCKAAAEA